MSYGAAIWQRCKGACAIMLGSKSRSAISKSKLAPLTGNANSSAPTAKNSKPNVAGSQPLAMIVEDSPVLALQSAAALAEAGFSTVIASGVDEARRWLATYQFAAILLDLDLADSTCDQTISIIPELSASAPVIVVTGSGTSMTVDEAVSAGALGYVIKGAQGTAREIRSQVRWAMSYTAIFHA